MIEIYWSTDKLRSYRQPYAELIKLTQPDESLLEQVGRNRHMLSTFRRDPEIHR
jgi:hypothetical protein